MYVCVCVVCTCARACMVCVYVCVCVCVCLCVCVEHEEEQTWRFARFIFTYTYNTQTHGTHTHTHVYIYTQYTYKLYTLAEGTFLSGGGAPEGGCGTATPPFVSSPMRLSRVGRKALAGTNFFLPSSSIPQAIHSSGVRQSYSVSSNISRGRKGRNDSEGPAYNKERRVTGRGVTG